MILDYEQIQRINEANRFIINFSPWFEDQEESLIFSEERAKDIVENKEYIENLCYDFPGDDYGFEIETFDFLNLIDEIESIKIINNGHIKTNLRSFFIVGATDSYEEYIIAQHYDFELYPLKGVKINLSSESFIVGLVAVHLEEYDSDYWGTIEQYLVVEVVYSDKNKRISPEQEHELITSFLFEVADTTGIALTLSEIRNPIIDDPLLDEDAEETSDKGLRDLEPYNEGMNLFISAVQIQEPELKFLNFYKVLEHFSPIAVNIEANELMRKKLDAPKSLFENGDYIRSIFNLANAMRDRFNDEDLIKASFNTCFDFVGLYKFLPETIKKKIKKHCSIKEINYSTDKQKITTACNMAAKIIYKTRNKVVHAKSNYSLTGDEITSDELIELNYFMKEASSQSIRWYSRQPKHLKQEVIK